MQDRQVIGDWRRRSERTPVRARRSAVVRPPGSRARTRLRIGSACRHTSRSRSSDSMPPRYPASASARSSAETSRAALQLEDAASAAALIAGTRAKSALTHDSTRSSAAANGSAASGKASNIWHGTPADRSTSRATYTYGRRCRTINAASDRATPTHLDERRASRAARPQRPPLHDRARPSAATGVSKLSPGGMTSTGRRRSIGVSSRTSSMPGSIR